MSNKRVLSLLFNCTLSFCCLVGIYWLVSHLGELNKSGEFFMTILTVVGTVFPLATGFVQWAAKQHVSHRERLTKLEESLAPCIKQVFELRERLEEVECTINQKLLPHLELYGHQGICAEHEDLEKLVLTLEAQVQVFGRFQKVYEEVSQLRESLGRLQGMIDERESGN